MMTRVIEPGTVVLPAAAVYSMAIDRRGLGARLRARRPLLGARRARDRRVA